MEISLIVAINVPVRQTGRLSGEGRPGKSDDVSCHGVGHLKIKLTKRGRGGAVCGCFEHGTWKTLTSFRRNVTATKNTTMHEVMGNSYGSVRVSLLEDSFWNMFALLSLKLVAWTKHNRHSCVVYCEYSYFNFLLILFFSLCAFQRMSISFRLKSN